MNSNRHFDEHIKEQFSNYTPDVHPRIWEKIIVEKDKKRPAGFWVSMFNSRNKLLLLGLIVALSSGGAWLYYNTTTKIKADSLNVTDVKKISRNIDDKNTGTANQPLPDNPSANQLSVDQTLNTTTDNKATADDISAGNKYGLSSNSNTKTNIFSPLPSADDETVNTGYNYTKNKKNYTGLGNVLVNTTSPDTEQDEYAEQGGTMLGRLTFNAEKITEKKRSEKKETLHFNAVVFLPDCPSFEKNASGNKKYFEFYAGPDYAFRSLQDTGNSSYLQKRKESTKFKSGYSAGVRYTKVFNNSMSVRGGVNYSQINEKFTFNQGNVVQVTYIINNNGDTVGSYTTTGSRNKTTINRYRSVDIPLVLGYELGNGKLHANINAGAIVNIYSWQKGDVLDAAGNPVSITTGKNSSPYQFKTNAGIGFIGAVSVYYKLNNRLHIMAEPYFRYNLSQLNKESITLKQKYQTAGLRLGIRLDLNQRQQK
jgi:hypothetical protein